MLCILCSSELLQTYFEVGTLPLRCQPKLISGGPVRTSGLRRYPFSVYCTGLAGSNPPPGPGIFLTLAGTSFQYNISRESPPSCQARLRSWRKTKLFFSSPKLISTLMRYWQQARNQQQARDRIWCPSEPFRRWSTNTNKCWSGVVWGARTLSGEGSRAAASLQESIHVESHSTHQPSQTILRLGYTQAQ